MDFKASDNVPGDVANELDAGAAVVPSEGPEEAMTKAMTMNKADTGSDALIAAKAGEALVGAMAEAAKGDVDSKTVNARRFTVVTDNTRDARLTDFGKETLTDRYLLPGENYQDLFARVADAYADDQAHAQRLYDYISKLWFMPATPVLSNGGTHRGLPISCYLNSVSDSLEGIVNTWNENVWLASKGGGIGTYWGNV
ncbi:MAG: ribonucleotide-diphosphate reductase subunit alpha, partial [Erythrobacter sp.]|nr:ribonucleotide-diphosphate reductase subunit alpha [Erythrobacter sp.]